jgi:protein-tyrosine phosphatase
VTERRLSWDGCLNVRDLGGHPTGDGSQTRMRAIVRADSVRQLSDAGWEQLVDYGVRTVVDLRRPSELEQDPPAELPVHVVHVPLLGELTLAEEMAVGQRWLAAPDDVSATRDGYLEMLEQYRENFAAAVSTIGAAPDGGVLVHCAGGKDRTGLVAAVLLRLAGVSLDDIASDYALSAENLAPILDAWLDAAADDNDREFRRRISGSPPEAMADVLREIEGRYGSVRDYLLAGGATEADIERARARLREA